MYLFLPLLLRVPTTFNWQTEHTILRNDSYMIDRCHAYNATHTPTAQYFFFKSGDLGRLSSSLNLNSVFTGLVDFYTKIFAKHSLHYDK